jgi:hypothetical protein
VYLNGHVEVVTHLGQGCRYCSIGVCDNKSHDEVFWRPASLSSWCWARTSHSTPDCTLQQGDKQQPGLNSLSSTCTVLWKSSRRSTLHYMFGCPERQFYGSMWPQMHLLCLWHEVTSCPIFHDCFHYIRWHSLLIFFSLTEKCQLTMTSFMDVAGYKMKIHPNAQFVGRVCTWCAESMILRGKVVSIHSMQERIIRCTYWFASDHWLIACWSRFTDTNGTNSYKSDELCARNHVVRFPSSIVFTSWYKYNEERQVYLLIRFLHVLSCCPIGIIDAREMYNECSHNSPHWHIDPPPQQSQEPSWWVLSLVEWICRKLKEKRGFYFEPFEFPSSGVGGAQGAYLWSALQWWHPVHEVSFQLVGLLSLNTKLLVPGLVSGTFWSLTLVAELAGCRVCQSAVCVCMVVLYKVRCQSSVRVLWPIG